MADNRQMSNESQKADEGGETVLFQKKIGEKELLSANATLERYKDGKKNLDSRIISNEQWWKLKQWEEIRDNSPKQSSEPSSGWLFNCIISKHADYDEAYPTFNCLPREEGDREEAEKLSSIIPVVLEQNRFRDTYSDCGWQKLKFGTAVYGIFWDNEKYNGLGDISIEKVDALSIFFEPGVTDIQKSRNVFRTQLVDNDILENRYPELKGKLAGNMNTTNRYRYDDNVNTDNKSLVVDWYYHTYSGKRKVLQYCRYVGTYCLQRKMILIWQKPDCMTMECIRLSSTRFSRWRGVRSDLDILTSGKARSCLSTDSARLFWTMRSLPHVLGIFRPVTRLMNESSRIRRKCLCG